MVMMTRFRRSPTPAFAQALTRVLPARAPVLSQPRSPISSRLHARVTPPVAATQSLPETTFRLAPSDFAFLWEECKRCFYLKAHKKLYRPRAPFPSIFGNIDLAMKRHFRGLRTQDLFPEMNSGTFLCEEDDAWVECQPITPPGHSHSVYIRGMVDCLVRFDDGTFGIMDFKTSSSSKKNSSTYARQLHAYAYALERPSANSELIRGDVSDMGLVVYTPTAFHTPMNYQDAEKLVAAMTGDIGYVQVKRDDEGFMSFLGEVLDVLTLNEAPEAPKKKRGSAHSSCPYCSYLQMAKAKGFIPE